MAPRALLAAAAAAGPTLLAYNVSPSPTFLNQALAIALWGLFVGAAALGPVVAAVRGAGALYAALAVMLGAVLWSWSGALPMGLALSAVGLLLAAGVLVASAAHAHAQPDTAAVFGDFCVGWAVAGVLNIALAMIQVFWPELPDGAWIAHSGIPGRAVGNLRQPNHLSSVLMWSAIAFIALAELRRIGRGWAAALFALTIFSVVLTASRTGLLSVGLLAVWALVDRRLARSTRLLLLAAPLIYAAGWLGMAEWAKLSEHTFGGAARLAETDISGSRFGIWRNSLALIRQQPWAGVGFGDFNFAWTLTPFPGRPVAFFDHTHDLPLQLAVEIGIPLAAVVMLLLLAALLRAGWLAWAQTGDVGTGRRCALLMVLMIGLHSLLEYPLWYSYFLLPAAWAWAFAVGAARPAGVPPARARSALLRAASAALVIGSLLSVLDYARVAAIFGADAGADPLPVRIERGQHSVLFAHHADYAAATAETPLVQAQGLKPFERASHYLLDTRLMIAWARALARHGDVDAARYVAARLREFRNPNADEFFAPCKTAATPPPFQCEPPRRDFDWRDFNPRR